MAKVKKVKPEEVTVDVENIEVVEEVEIPEATEVEEVLEDVAETVETVEVPEVKVEEPKEADVVVDKEVAKVDPANKPSGNVKIRMRVDHKCTIAMERYDLKAGKTYTVPENVKRILNNAGLLAPL